MSQTERGSILSLPSPLAIFPLEGALLLPHGHLPLHIFEPRYRTMIETALGSGRIIGMVQPRGEVSHPLPDDALIFDIGCAGRIVSFAETDDGRFFVTLKGLCRFRIVSELPLLDGYRRVTVDYRHFACDLDDSGEVSVDRARLLAAARSYLDTKNIGCDWSAADAAPTAALITTFAMTCPFEPREKQALLETPTIDERGALLISLFEMAALAHEGTPSSAQH